MRGRARGADSVILGCTEIGLLLGPQDIDFATRSEGAATLLPPRATA